MRLLALALLCVTLLAQATELPSRNPNKVPRIEGPSFRPGSSHYPAEVAQAGVQGIVYVLVPLAEDGTPTGASLGESSGSSQLDDIAVNLVRATKFKIDEAPKEGWKNVLLSVEFARDSVTTVKSKSCAEFTADVAYYRATFPDRALGDMRVLTMLTGLAYLERGAKPQYAAEIAKRSAGASQPTVDQCRAQPERTMFDVWRAAFERAA